MFGISRNALTIFGFDVHWYGLIIAAGVLAAVLLACAREKQLGFERDTALNVALAAVPAALICARIYYVAFSWGYYAANPGEIFNIRGGGMAIYGGIIGGVLAGYIYCRLKKLSFLKGLDLAAPSIALGQAIGRWGNFINREAYGRAVTNPALQFFPVAVEIDGAWHYAAFFYESVWCFLITAFILIAERKRFFHRDGDVFGAYLLLYGMERALVEGLRTDSLYLGPLRISQLLSLSAVFFVCAVLARRAKGTHAALRALPAVLMLLLGTSLALERFALSAAFALLLLGASAVLYIRQQKQRTMGNMR